MTIVTYTGSFKYIMFLSLEQKQILHSGNRIITPSTSNSDSFYSYFTIKDDAV